VTPFADELVAWRLQAAPLQTNNAKQKRDARLKFKKVYRMLKQQAKECSEGGRKKDSVQQKLSARLRVVQKTLTIYPRSS
jgi:hypothetical protein